MNDPWDTTVSLQSNIVWGQCIANAWWCVLEKGIGKIEFDPQVHSGDRRRTAIDITIRPLNLEYDVTRSMIAESREWSKVVLPSIRKLGLLPRQLNGAWVKAQIVTLTDNDGNPVTYINKSGSIKEKTTIQFIAIFDSEEACRADYEAHAPTTKEREDMGNSDEEVYWTAFS